MTGRASLYRCERCGIWVRWGFMRWRRRHPEDSAPSWAVCEHCDQRLSCESCGGKGCPDCGRRAARWNRAAEHHNEKQRRKDEHRAELERRGEDEPGPDPLSSELEELWMGWYFDSAVRDKPPHRAVQRSSLVLSPAPPRSVRLP